MLCFYCLTVNVLWLFLTVPWVGLQCAVVVFPVHTHLLFGFLRILMFSCWLWLLLHSILVLTYSVLIFVLLSLFCYIHAFCMYCIYALACFSYFSLILCLLVMMAAELCRNKLASGVLSLFLFQEKLLLKTVSVK